MKKQFILSTLFSLVLLFTACQSEDESLKSPENQKGQITFALPAPSGTVSYATVVASADENLLKRLDIYMFNQDGILEYLYGDVTANGSGASRTASIDITGKAGTKTFYFVANAQGQSDELDNTVIGTTTLSEFKEIMTDKQTAQIKASDGLLMSATKTIADIGAELTTADKTVNLRRRVARFDILNDASVTNFAISGIIVSNAKLRNYLFEDATGTPEKVIETDKLPVAAFNTTDFPNANTATLVTGAFYLYPTSLEEGKTEISIAGLFNGTTRIYTVSLPAATPIKANYRYILKAKKMDIVNITWEVAIEEWEDGSEVETEPGDPLFSISELSRTGGTGGILDAAARTYDITDATTASVLSFTTSSVNKLGTTATVTYKYDTDHSSLPGFVVNTPQPVLTYGASYTQDYKINIPVQTSRERIEVLITISDVVNPQQKISILLRSDPNYGHIFSELSLSGGTGGVLDAAAKTYDITLATTASVINFKASTIHQQGTTATVTYKYDTDGSSLPGFAVVTPQPVLTYGTTAYTQDYTINIPVQTPRKAIEVTITIADVVNPKQKINILIRSNPNYQNLFSALSRTGGTGGIFDADAKTYDISDVTTASVLSIKTSSLNKQGTTATVAYKYDTKHLSLPSFTVAIPQPVKESETSYTQDYKINIPVQTTKVPIEMVITISDVVNPLQKTSIVVRSNPKYNNTAYKPVLFGGKYWAPVNVGATNVDATTLNEASMGRVFQWGRTNSGWVTKATTAAFGDEIAGPLTFANATNATNKDKFITNNTSPYNWVTIDANYTQAMQDALWTGANTQAVCPTGWRLLTEAELTTISTAYSTDKFSAVTHRLAIPGDNAGETLYLPAAGRRNYNDGSSTAQGTNGYYWSSDISGSNASRLHFGSTSSSVGATYRGFTFSIRCIQAD